MKILIIGGLHGNEPLGVQLVQALIKNPIQNVDALIGNPNAVATNVRFIDVDLNRVFPGKAGGNAEEQRAAELMQSTAGYDVVLDFHNTHAPNNDCGFVGGTQYETLLPIASTLGLDKVVVADYDCINKYVPTCMSVEVSLSSTKNDVAYWVKKIKKLATNDELSTVSPTLYQFVYRVTAEQQKSMGFDWLVFTPIETQDVEKLGLAKGTYYPIFVEDEYTPQNYAGLIAAL